MHGFAFLEEIVLLLAASVGVILLFNRFRIPPVVGLMVTGLLMGPTGFGLVTQGDVIAVVSEIGVILLLFAIGLEFSIEEISRMRSIVFIAGPLQLLFGSMVIGGGTLAVYSGLDLPMSFEGALIIGLAMALSSTAMCTKLLKDRKELKVPHGRMVTGILIFQDMAVVPLMLLVAILSPTAAPDTLGIIKSLAMMVGVTLFLLLGLRFVMPRILPHVARSNSPETLILGGLALCLGTAWLTGQAGMSMAMGAFIAGMSIGGSNEGYAFGRVLQPFRDAFTSMFFVSIGLLVNITWASFHISVATALALLAVNTFVVLIVLVTLRVNVRTAAMSALILAQVGEFSFVLAKSAADHTLITKGDLQNLIVSIIITMIVTPLLIKMAPWFADRTVPVVRRIRPVRQWYTRSDGIDAAPDVSAGEENKPLVLIVGAGVLGSNVAEVLDQTQIPYCVLELDHDKVMDLRNRGCFVVEGDVTDRDALMEAGIRTAHVVVIAISDSTALSSGVHVVRRERPDVLIIARTRYAVETQVVAKEGADIVITEEYESSIQVFVTLLEYLGVPYDVIQEQELEMRSNSYGALTRLQRWREKSSNG